ncbi:hypothetical protein [Mucilaginibacter boryungensis]|uniref:Lipoprotein n=1 Tax=Mucilaginibacter boryungensis TaxID=768480 RepID=A0ABR9XGC3_9SPHI|nr:hypothetical protein [Mucilaginibacter boryungensis]MBE9666281.1 hypothetical protein [Mucilaginibacter boryungensis]
MKIKILVTAFWMAGIFSSCSDDKGQEKTLMTDIMNKHDTVMGKSDLIIKYRTSLDSVTKTSKDTTEVHALKSQLNMADEAMETWMHKFNPDFTGKSHAEVITYLQSQKKQIGRVDSLINLSLDKTDKYLKKK